MAATTVGRSSVVALDSLEPCILYLFLGSDRRPRCAVEYHLPESHDKLAECNVEAHAISLAIKDPDSGYGKCKIDVSKHTSSAGASYQALLLINC